MIYMAGGPPHQDMYDLKMDAPSEVRGEFRPIRTNVAGIQICELLPRIARIMDKLVPIRSIVGASERPLVRPVPDGAATPQNLRPGRLAGAGRGRVRGWRAPRTGIPPFMGLSPRIAAPPGATTARRASWEPPTPPSSPEDEGKDDMMLKGITLERLRDRKSLLASFDQFRRDADASGAMDGRRRLPSRRWAC